MTGFVYAIGDGERVKIGWSEDPIRRLNKIRSDCPDEAHLLGLISATRMQEAEAHKLLAPWHIRGEWFRHEGAVAAFIDMLPRPRPRPDLSILTHPIEHIRKRIFGVTQGVFAEIAATTQASVSRWESGELHPDRAEMERIRKAARKQGIAWEDRWFFEVPVNSAA